MKYTHFIMMNRGGTHALILSMITGVACSPADTVDDAGPTATVDAGDAGMGDSVAALLEPIRATHGLVSLGGAVVDLDGAVVFGATGLRREGGTTSVTTDDRWHLGSDTKAMTATLAAILVERGDIAWETTVSEVFTEFAASIDPALRDITMLELFTHRSGLDGDLIAQRPEVWARLWEMREPIESERRWFSEQLLTTAPSVPPRTMYVYSNAGYMVAGAMLEAVTGETWESLMETLLFAPLGMTSCGFGAPASVGLEDAPWGHTAGPSPIPPGPAADNPPALGPAGTVHCSLEDWAKFIALHLRGARGDTTLLTRASFERLQADPGIATPADFGYGYGWGITTRAWAGGTTLTHTGSNTMFYAVAWLSLAHGRAYLAVTNQADAGAGSGTDAAVGALLAAYPPTP